MSSPRAKLDRWGQPPWEIDFPPARQSLPQEADFAVVGAARTEGSDESFREQMKDAVTRYARDEFESQVWDELAAGMRPGSA